jgi:hypothetical protein
MENELRENGAMGLRKIFYEGISMMKLGQNSVQYPVPVLEWKLDVLLPKRLLVSHLVKQSIIMEPLPVYPN